MKCIILIISLHILPGCASMIDPGNMEAAWQTMHVVDVLQTANGIAENPLCSIEDNALTRAFIGKNPRKSNVYKWGIGSSLAHYVLFKWVDKRLGGEPNHWNIFLRSLDLGQKLNTIASNHSEGVRIDGYSRKARAECDEEISRQQPRGNIANFEWKF